MIERARRFLRADDGAVAIILALAMVPFLAASGAAVDMSRAYLVKVRLGHALDATALAVGSSRGTEAELQEIARRFFQANYPGTVIGVARPPTVRIEGNTITVSTSATVNTTLMRVAGIDTITVGASASVMRETTGLEVALALDNTGSMAGSKLTALKQASRDLINILFGDREVADRVFIGIVPFAATVNVGTDRIGLLGGSFNPADFSPDTWGGCIEERLNGHDQLDTSIAEGGAWRPYRWGRDRFNNWPPLSGTNPQLRGPNRDCPQPITPLTNRKSPLLRAVDAMTAQGFTHINLGIVWAWRLISPDPPFTEARPYGDRDYNKALILMTDGVNVFPNPGYTAYGRLADQRLGTNNPFVANNELDVRTSRVCTNVKQRGIIVYTIVFQVTEVSVENLMRNCATDASKYFNSPTNEALRQAFQTIGAQLSNLHVSR